MTLYARAGEWVTCDGRGTDGRPVLHDIGDFIRDIEWGEPPSAEMFDTLLAKPPEHPDWGKCPFTPCPGRFWQAQSAADGFEHGVFHVEHNWRDKPSIAAVPKRPAYADVETLVAAEGRRQQAEAIREVFENYDPREVNMQAVVDDVARTMGFNNLDHLQDNLHVPWWRRIWAMILRLRHRVRDSWSLTRRPPG